MTFAKEATVISLEERKKLQPVIEYAVIKHAGQFRKYSGLPYIVHSMGVLAQLGAWDVQCFKSWSATICHDIREECPDVTFSDLESVIGKESSNIVEELSFFPDLNSDISISDQKKEYMKTFKTKSVEALVIKAADRISNTMDFLNSDPNYAKKYWKKADSLFEAVISRGKEIADTFGPSTFPRIRYTRMVLIPMLV